MKKIIATLCFIHFLTLSFGQNSDIKILVDSLQYLKVDSLDCKATIYWKIVAHGDKAIPFLIGKLNDTTLTSISHKCKVTKLNVGEVAYFALQQIAFFPAFVITHIQFDVIYGNGCWSFFDYFFNNANKKHYQDLVRTWYSDNKTKYKEQKISKKQMTECQKKYHIEKYLMWTE
jgi:hypothetical protein